MLTRSSFGNDSMFAESFGKQNLTNGIIDFVGTCVIQIFSFKKDVGLIKIR